MNVLSALGDALRTAFEMFWEILWPLVLGFALSGVVQAIVSHSSMARLLGKDSPSRLCLSGLLGIASSSCSYAAVALARSIFRKGASFTNAMAFSPTDTMPLTQLAKLLMLAESAASLLSVAFVAARAVNILS